MRGDGTPAREATEALAAEGKHERGAAQSEPDYVYALPERYRRKWERSGIGERVQEVTRQTRTSLKALLSFTPEKHVEAAVRKEYGGFGSTQPGHHQHDADRNVAATATRRCRNCAANSASGR